MLSFPNGKAGIHENLPFRSAFWYLVPTFESLFSDRWSQGWESLMSSALHNRLLASFYRMSSVRHDRLASFERMSSALCECLVFFSSLLWPSTYSLLPNLELEPPSTPLPFRKIHEKNGRGKTLGRRLCSYLSFIKKRSRSNRNN